MSFEPLGDPPPPGLFHWPAQWAYIARAFRLIYDGIRALHTDQELLIMDTTALTAAVDANASLTAEVKSLLVPLTAAVIAEISEVSALLALIKQGPADDPAATQAIADAAAKAEATNADLTIVRDALSSLTSQTTADDSTAPAGSPANP